MKFVFFGTPRFASIVIGRLIEEGFPPVAIVTKPDRPVGRKKIVTPPPVKKTCLKINPHIPILQPEKLDENFLIKLRETNADFFLIAAYGKIFPKKLLEIPHLGTIGVHPSLLPCLRGATPIQSAILSGLSKTGISLFLVDEKMDHGPIISQEELDIHSHDNAESLSDRLAILGADMVASLIPKIENIKPLEQNESEATFTGKISTDDAYIEPEELKKAEEGQEEFAKMINRKIRAYSPEPGAWTIRNNKRVKLLDAELKNDGSLKLKSIQVEGKKPIII